jgi:hypothetical protein
MNRSHTGTPLTPKGWRTPKPSSRSPSGTTPTPSRSARRHLPLSPTRRALTWLERVRRQRGGSDRSRRGLPRRTSLRCSYGRPPSSSRPATTRPWRLRLAWRGRHTQGGRRRAPRCAFDYKRSRDAQRRPKQLLEPSRLLRRAQDAVPFKQSAGCVVRASDSARGFIDGHARAVEADCLILLVL